MPRIFVLPEHIASQIAAGEVVERPASVVKELVENSIDAGATKIIVDVSEACRYIRVSDNGCGMEAADVSLAFQRHATSKLSTANDLWNLHTLGFRGEALPSIASVSKLNCSTRTEKSEAGTKVVSVDGRMTVTETGCAKGTIIEVEELFYNVPARLSFLKKPGTEFAHILDIMQSLAISYPHIAFALSLDGNLRLKTSGKNELDRAIVESNFITEQENFITLSGKDGVMGLAIEGRLISPKNFRGDRKGIMTIVNKRPVRCALAYKALDYAYADLIPRGRYPLSVIHLTVKPDEVDVNIHPTKKEIRYSRGNDVYLFLQRQIVQALRNGGAPKTEIRAEAKTSFFDRDIYAQQPSKQLSLAETGDAVYFDSLSSVSLSTISKPIDAVTTDNSITYKNILETIPKDDVNDISVFSPPLSLPLDWHLIGYFGNTYILLETSDGLSVIEQHIAHERVLYERLLARKVQTEGQTLLISLPLRLTSEQKSVLEENMGDLQEQGFEFEIEGENFNCSQVPVELAHKDYASIIQKMLQELAESSMVNPRLDIVKSIACQSAVKNGMHLAEEQIIELLSEWHKTSRNETCPHGRPIQLSFSYDKLFQMFHPA